MSYKPLQLLTIISSLCLFGLLPQRLLAQQAPVLMENVRIIVGDGNVLETGSVLIQNGSILAVADSNDVTVPANTQRMDLAGKTLMPALIDAHGHLGYQGRDSWGAENYDRENLIDNLQQYAFYGFAAVFSAGSDPVELGQEIQVAHEAGEYQGARFLFAVGMAPPGAGPNNQFLTHALAVEQATGMTILRGLKTAEQARSLVAQIAAQDVGFIKLWVDDRGGSQPKLAPELYRAVISESNAQGLKVFIHQQFAQDMPDLLEAGAHGFLHGRIGDELDLAIAGQIAQGQAFVVPNLGLGELRQEAIGEDAFLQQVLGDEATMRLSTGGRRELAPVPDPQFEREQSDSIARLIEAGVDIVLGTDAGAVPDHPFGYTGHRELEIYVRLGMTPMQAILAGTSKAAAHLGLTDMGKIEPGFSADLLILDENPLQDITNTQSINAVYLRGEKLDREALLLRWQQ